MPFLKLVTRLSCLACIALGLAVPLLLQALVLVTGCSSATGVGDQKKPRKDVSRTIWQLFCQYLGI